MTVSLAPASSRPQGEVQRETDQHRLAQRQKQIDLGKNTLGYQRYREAVPRCVGPDPALAPAARRSCAAACPGRSQALSLVAGSHGWGGLRCACCYVAPAGWLGATPCCPPTCLPPSPFACREKRNRKKDPSTPDVYQVRQADASSQVSCLARCAAPAGGGWVGRWVGCAGPDAARGASAARHVRPSSTSCAHGGAGKPAPSAPCNLLACLPTRLPACPPACRSAASEPLRGR